MTAGSVEPVLVLGLGNLLLQDDAVGLRLLEAVADSRPEVENRMEYGVEYMDGGTQGLALLGYLAGRRAVLILDAVGLGAEPGRVHVLEGEAIDNLRACRATTAHEGNALELLATARLLGDYPDRVAVVGIEPGRVATGVGLSPAVEAAIPQACQRARALLGPMLERLVCA